MYLSYAGDTAEIELVRDGEHIQVELQKRTCSDQKGQPYQGFGLYLTAGLVESDGIGTWLRYVWYQTVDYVQLVWFSLRQLCLLYTSAARRSTSSLPRRKRN